MNQLISILVVAVLAAGFSSCTSSRHISRKDWYENYDDYGRPLPDRKGRSKSGKKKGGSKVKPPKIVATGTARDVIDLAYGWLGTPYRYGGDSRHGTDCSGLTCYAFENGAGIKLPRSSSDQADYCKKISERDLRPGDLVFFVNKAGGSRINRVGLYAGEGKMIHASSSQGVTVTSLDDPYWRARLYRCGRVL